MKKSHFELSDRFGAEYVKSSLILSIHIWACIFVFQRALFSKWLIITNNYRYSLYTHLIGAFSNIVLNILLIPLYAGVGAAIASLISYGLAGFVSLLFFKQTRPFATLIIKAMINCIPNCISLLSCKMRKNA